MVFHFQPHETDEALNYQARLWAGAEQLGLTTVLMRVDRIEGFLHLLAQRPELGHRKLDAHFSELRRVKQMLPLIAGADTLGCGPTKRQKGYLEHATRRMAAYVRELAPILNQPEYKGRN